MRKKPSRYVINICASACATAIIIVVVAYVIAPGWSDESATKHQYGFEFEKEQILKYGREQYLDEMFGFKVGPLQKGCSIAVTKDSDRSDEEYAAAKFCVQQVQHYLHVACPANEKDVREGIEALLRWYESSLDSDISFAQAMREALPDCR